MLAQERNAVRRLLRHRLRTDERDGGRVRVGVRPHAAYGRRSVHATFRDECVFQGVRLTERQLERCEFIGGESKKTDPRAPYLDCWWYSLPNDCPLSKWANKTEECRDTTRQGLCDMDTLPDGIKCTYNYRILGFVPIDDVVGITAMTNKATSEKYNNFTEFCEAGGVEFQASEAGVWNASIPFWKDPQNATANAARTEKLLSAYANLLKTSTSSQVKSDAIKHMKKLPTVAELTAGNPPCYFNVKDCDSEFGCKREHFGQMCTLCNSTGSGCIPPTENFTFPTLDKALTADATTGSTSSSSRNVLALGAVFASIIALSFLMG